MTITQRYLADFITKDLAKKIVLLSGPRQAGKTTLARSLQFRNIEYLNFDDLKHRTRIIQRDWQQKAGLVIFDELHKRTNGSPGSRVFTIPMAFRRAFLLQAPHALIHSGKEVIPLQGGTFCTGCTRFLLLNSNTSRIQKSSSKASWIVGDFPNRIFPDHRKMQ